MCANKAWDQTYNEAILVGGQVQRQEVSGEVVADIFTYHMIQVGLVHKLVAVSEHDMITLLPTCSACLLVHVGTCTCL